MPNSKENQPSETKGTSSYSKKNNESAVSEINPSKYQPTEDADMNVQQLGAQDGVLKLFEDAVKDLYWAEIHLTKALPKMISAASAESLSKALKNHLNQTQMQVQRIEQIFDVLNKPAQARKCAAMEGLTKEGESVIEETDMGTPARDLGIIMSAQKVEHYEISAYTGLNKLATRLGLTDIAELLAQTLAEEQQSDEILAMIAEQISFSEASER